jgi:hypothetical protein
MLWGYRSNEEVKSSSLKLTISGPLLKNQTYSRFTRKLKDKDGKYFIHLNPNTKL